MKTSFAAIASLILGASMAYAALEPAATMAPRVHKRQAIPDGLDISAVLANPSSYLKHASSLLSNPKYASQFSKVTADPKFEKSISKELVAQFGSKTASIALQQYTAALGGGAGGAAAAATASSGSNNDLASGSESGVIAAATGTPASSSNSGSLQISGNQISGASTTFTVTVVGSAISLGAMVVLAM